MARKGIFFPLKDAALRDDVHALGALVGDVLQGPVRRRRCSTRWRATALAAIGRRAGRRRTVASSSSCAPQGAHAAGGAASWSAPSATWFQVVNLAEKVHRVRRRRQYMNDSSTPAAGRARGVLRAGSKARGLTLEQVVELLGRLRIEPVFTAHPTESTRRTLLRQQQRIARLLIERLDPTLTPARAARDHRARAHGAHDRLADRGQLARAPDASPTSASTCCSSWSR